MNYREAQYKRVENIIHEKYWIFNGDAGGGQYGKRNYPFILQDANNNLYKEKAHVEIDSEGIFRNVLGEK